MNPHGIVMVEMQCRCRFEIVELLRKCICGSSKSTHLLSDGQVLQFNMICQIAFLSGCAINGFIITFSNSEGLYSRFYVLLCTFTYLAILFKKSI